MRSIVFELCAETLQACVAARAGGAHRIELCTALREDGLTPSHALIERAILRSGLPVHVLLRPRAGNFVYSPDELDVMRRDLLHVRDLSAAGVVLGILQPDGCVDVERTSALVATAAPLPVTFHRAFDRAASLEQALEDVIATGCTRILTSGGAPTVYAGAPMLARLVAQAGDRIVVAAGGGLRLSGAAELAHATGVTHYHGSIRRLPSPPSQDDEARALPVSAPNDLAPAPVLPDDVRAVIQALSS